jgi:hypothetical protein
MKHKITALISMLFFGAILSAQMPGGITMQQASGPQGTTLGANTTSGAAGIALGNRVVMRGYVDFVFKYDDEDVNTLNSQTEAFKTSSDIDFLFDFSPLTAEIHTSLNASPDKVKGEDAVTLEQAFGRYSVNRDFNFSFGRQLTVLGYEADEAPGLHAVSNGYWLGNRLSTNANLGADASKNSITESVDQLRRNYVDGIRANFNNGRFGLTLGLHDGYWKGDDFNGDSIALDIAASLMIIPGLEARLGYAQQQYENQLGNSDDISQLNGWLAYNVGNLTLATEFDNMDILSDEYWSMMFLANYQFANWMGATIRYSHEDYEAMSVSGGSSVSANSEADRLTFALLFSITENFGLNVEYSTTSVDSTSVGDYDEFYVEGLITY